MPFLNWQFLSVPVRKFFEADAPRSATFHFTSARLGVQTLEARDMQGSLLTPADFSGPSSQTGVSGFTSPPHSNG